MLNARRRRRMRDFLLARLAQVPGGTLRYEDRGQHYADLVLRDKTGREIMRATDDGLRQGLPTCEIGLLQKRSS